VSASAVDSVVNSPLPAAGAAERRRWFEQAIYVGLFACALLSIATTIGIVVVLLAEASQFFREVSIVEFLTGTEWSPKLAHKFGILSAVALRHDVGNRRGGRDRAADRAGERDLPE
jgi:ABC-type phosphate transport system permease subunit